MAQDIFVTVEVDQTAFVNVETQKVAEVTAVGIQGLPGAAGLLEDIVNVDTTGAVIGSVLVYRPTDNVWHATIPPNISLAGDSGTDIVTLSTQVLNIIGGEGIDTLINPTTNSIIISGELATNSNLGIASFNSASFNVTAGDVTIKSGGVSNTQLANSSITIGSTNVALGSTATSFTGLTELTIDNININGNTISTTDTDGDIVFQPNGEGVINVSGKRIVNVAYPSMDNDVVNKLYVDTLAAEGLHVQEGVDAATTNTLAILSGGTVTYNNGFDGVGATLTTTTSFITGNPIDGVVLTASTDYTLASRVLVKNETNRANNGIYFLYSSTVLMRDPLFDSDADIEGGDFVFVVEGTINASTGWAQTNTVNVIGTDEIIWKQFSGAGTYTAGSGLSLIGTQFNVKLAASDGLEFSGSNEIQLKSTVAGGGLTYGSGVLSVGGTTNRITVNADSIDIASTYVGQTSITTLGTIDTGVWNATTISTTKGGTGLTGYATGDLLYASATNTLSKLAAATNGQVLQLVAGVPAWGDIDGGTY